MVTRSDVVKQARSYVGTTYKRQGRTRTRGLDCAGLIIVVARDLETADYPEVPYTETPDPEFLYQRFLYGGAIPGRVSDLKPGDMVIMSPGVAPVHCGIIREARGKPTLIHAHQPRRTGAEDSLDATPLGLRSWRATVNRVLLFPDLED